MNRPGAQRRNPRGTYVRDIIRILHGRKAGMSKTDLDRAVLGLRQNRGQRIPKYFDRAVQSVLNHFTSQSIQFRKRR